MECEIPLSPFKKKRKKLVNVHGGVQTILLVQVIA